MGEADRRTVLRWAAVVAAATALPACQARPDVELRLASGEFGGFLWEFAHLLRAEAERAEAARITPLRTGGSTENLDALSSGRAELALSLIDTATSRLDRDGLTAIGTVYENYFQIAVRQDSTIGSIADLRGRSVSTGARGSGASALSRRVIESAGFVEGVDVRGVELSLRAAVAALGAGTVDAAMWAGGLPTPALVSGGVDIRLLDLTDVITELRRRFGSVYHAVSVPADTYGSHAEVTTVGIANVLLARADVPDAVVAALVDVLIDDSSQLVPPEAVGSQFLDSQSLIQTGLIPLHPGAAEEYRRRHG